MLELQMCMTTFVAYSSAGDLTSGLMIVQLAYLDSRANFSLLVVLILIV